METYPVMAPETPLEITVSDLLALKNENSVHTLLDVRELQEIAVCRLDPCLHIPMPDVPASVDQLPSDRPLVVFCNHGMRSAQVVAWLRHNGFDNAIDLQGGIDRWALEIDPTMPTY